MSIGEEEAKGNDLTKEAFPLLRELTSLNFVGNVEGRDVFSGQVDVIVTDGFTGNVMLKLSEGLQDAVLSLIKRELSASAITKAGAVLARPAFQNLKKRLDYAEYGGAPLLGVRQIVVVGHGSSNARAIRNAIRSVKEFSEHGAQRAHRARHRRDERARVDAVRSVRALNDEWSDNGFGSSFIVHRSSISDYVSTEKAEMMAELDARHYSARDAPTRKAS